MRTVILGEPPPEIAAFLARRHAQIRWFARTGTEYEETGASTLLGITASDLVARIDWPR